MATATSFSPPDPARVGQVGGRRHHGEEDQGHRRWESEAQPCGDPAPQAGPTRADGDAQLAAGRAGQELAQGHQVGEAVLVDPTTTLDILPPEIADVRDGPAEGGQPQA